MAESAALDTEDTMRKRSRQNTNKKINDLLLALRINSEDYKENIVQEIIPIKDEAIPVLLSRLEEIIENPCIITDCDSQESIYIIYLLALFKAKEAFPLFIKILEMKDYEDLIGGDTITETMHRILASCYNGDLNSLESLAFNDNIDCYCCIAATEAIAVLYAQNLLSRKQLIEHLEEVFTKSEDSTVISTAIDIAINIHPEELMYHIINSYEEGIADTFFTGYLEEIEEECRCSTIRMALDKLKDNSRYDFITDLSEDMTWSL